MKVLIFLPPSVKSGNACINFQILSLASSYPFPLLIFLFFLFLIIQDTLPVEDKNDDVCCTCINASTGVCWIESVCMCVCSVCACVCVWSVVQGYNVGLGMCRLTGTFTLSTVSVCAASFSIWLTETHTQTDGVAGSHVDRLVRVL